MPEVENSLTVSLIGWGRLFVLDVRDGAELDEVGALVSRGKHAMGASTILCTVAFGSGDGGLQNATAFGKKLFLHISE